MDLDRDYEIKSISIHESFLRKQILLVNKRILSVREKFTLKDLERKGGDDGELVSVSRKEPIYRIYTEAQSKITI